MTEEYKIIGVRKDFSNDGWRFIGFQIKGVVGVVCPFVDANLEVEEINKFVDKKGRVTDIQKFLDAELAWAERQVGKIMTCDELSYQAFATCGKVSFNNPLTE